MQRLALSPAVRERSLTFQPDELKKMDERGDFHYTYTPSKITQELVCRQKKTSEYFYTEQKDCQFGDKLLIIFYH